MNSGLSPGDPMLVAAFRSALLHQGAIALLMLVLVWLLWGTARAWRSAPVAGAGAGGAGMGVFGESFGGIFAPGLSWLTGAPGGVLFYVAAGALIALPEDAWRSPRAGRLLLAGLSFGPDQNPMAAGSCARPGAAGVFTDAGWTWRSAGLTLPTEGRVRVLGLTALAGGNAALLAVSRPGANSLRAAWWDGTRWTVSAPVTADGVRALGFGPGGSAWLLQPGGRAETIAGAAGSTWRTLPPVPAGTEVLAPAGTGTSTSARGTGGSCDALSVAGSRLTVWRLAQGAWAKVQQVTVPLQYGSSG